MTNPDTSAAAEKLANWFGDCCDEYDPECSTCRAWEAFDAVSRDLEAMRAELHLMKTASIVEVAIRNPSVAEYMFHWEARAEQAEARVVELEAERAEIGKASVALLDELVAYLSQNAPAHKEALAGLKTARAALSRESGE